MARVTVEDCLKNVKNRFELVIVAAKRARQLMRGKEPKVAWDNDKPTVVALREIAAGAININNINEPDEQIAPPIQAVEIREEIVIIEEDESDNEQPESSLAQPSMPSETEE